MELITESFLGSRDTWREAKVELDDEVELAWRLRPNS